MAKTCNSCTERIANGNETEVCPFNCCGFNLPDLSGYSLKEKIDEYCDVQISLRQDRKAVAKRTCLAKGLLFYAKTDLRSAIKYAALSVCPVIGQKRHGHQRRIESVVLKSWSQKLLAASEEISHCAGGTFEKLFELLGVLRIKGIGPLTVYDTALRIASNLGCLPEQYVYLHAGSRIPGISHTKQRLPITKFSQEMRKMKAYEIEDFLCICKNYLSTKDRILI